MASNEQDNNTTTTAEIESLVLDVRSASGDVFTGDPVYITIDVVMYPNNARQIVQSIERLSEAITQHRQWTCFESLRVVLQMRTWHGDDPTSYAMQIFRALDNPYISIYSVNICLERDVDDENDDEEEIDVQSLVCRAIFEFIHVRADDLGLCVDIIRDFSIQEILDARMESNFRGKIDCLFELSQEGEDLDGLQLELSGIRSRLEILEWQHQPTKMFSDIVLAIQRRTDLRSFELSWLHRSLAPEIIQAVFEATASHPSLEYFGFDIYLHNVSELSVLFGVLVDYLSLSTCPKVTVSCFCREIEHSVWTNFTRSATMAVQSNVRLQDFVLRMSRGGTNIHYSQMPVVFKHILERNQYLADVQSGPTFSRPELAQALGTLAKKHATVKVSAMYHLIRTHQIALPETSAP